MVLHRINVLLYTMVICSSFKCLRFFATPVIVICANYLLDNWVREEVIYLVDNCVTIYGYVIFLASFLSFQ